MNQGPVDKDDAKVIKPKGRSQGYDRIFQLGPEKVAVLNSFLMTETYTIDSIIKMLKDEWGVFREVKDDTLRRQLWRYKKDFIVPSQAQIAAKLTSHPVVQEMAETVREIRQNIDAVKTLEWAIQIQIDRVKKTKEQEDKLPTVMDAQSKNIALLTQQVKELAAIQLDIGILKKVPARLQLSAELTDEELRFTEAQAAHERELAATAEAFRYMNEKGLIDVPQLPAARQTVEVVEKRPGDEEREYEADDPTPA